MWTIALVAVLSCTGACTAPAEPGAIGAAEPQLAQAQKTLTIGIVREPDDFAGFAGAGVYGGAGNVPRIAHDDLVVQDDTGAFRPLVAAELPSLERGTLQVKPDGTMDAIWKLRPNVRWHDGVPFTSADVLFAVEILNDPEVPKTRRGRPDLLRSATALDPLTIVVHWSAPFANASEGEALQGLLPAHLLEDAYRLDKTAFQFSPYHTTESIGLGPYRLAKWERGSHIEFVRFDAYYQGRPPLERVIVRFLGDPNTLVANILSRAVDVVLPDGVGIDAALEVQRRWEGTGNVVRFDVHGQLMHVEIQHRPELARPTFGLIHRTVRQALYHAIDRPALADALSHGMSPVADSWFPPGHTLHTSLESSIPQYPYDPRRAAELLGEAGWFARDADGVLVHAASGERFETQLWTAAEEKVLRIVSDNWQRAGVAVQTHVIPTARAGDSEYQVSYTGALVQSPSAGVFLESRLHSNFIRSAANRWRGANRTGYHNPRADAVMDRLAVALDPAERLSLHGQLLQEMLGDVAIMPLFWEVAPVLHLKGVKAHKVVRDTATWDFFGWDRE